MRDALRAGIAIYNEGRYHAAHDAWEDYWLTLESGADDERLLHGLIQFTAAVYHARNRNWVGAVGLATSALEYLEGLGEEYRGVDLARIRSFLETVAADPEVVERARPPTVEHEGDRLALGDLSLEETAVAAGIVAEETERYDETIVERASEYAVADREEGTSPFIALVFDFVRDAENRDLIYRRLSEHVDRRRRRSEDVEGLFD